MGLLDFLKILTNPHLLNKKIIFFLIFLNLSCYKVERNCSNFRFGTFKYERVIGDKLSTSYFTRNNDIEIASQKFKNLLKGTFCHVSLETFLFNKNKQTSKINNF